VCLLAMQSTGASIAIGTMLVANRSISCKNDGTMMCMFPILALRIGTTISMRGRGTGEIIAHPDMRKRAGAKRLCPAVSKLNARFFQAIVSMSSGFFHRLWR
jgi:hypothetical protein